MCALVGLGYTTAFSTWVPWDDEGYFLVTLKGYLAGARLFDQTAGAYGPFYFEFNAAVFRVFGLPVTNDAGRVVTVAEWLLATALLAGGVYLLSRSWMIAALSALVGFRLLVTAPPSEPMHASNLLVVLLAAMLLCAAAAANGPRGSPRGVFGVLGALVAAEALTKVNIGVFAAAALVFSALVSHARGGRGGQLASVVAIAYVLTPLATVGSFLAKPGFSTFATHVALAAAALTLAATSIRPRLPAERQWPNLGAALVGFTALASLSCGIVLAQGTSLRGLADGVALNALVQLRDGFYLAPRFPPWLLLLDAACVVALVAVRSRASLRSRLSPSVLAWGRLLAGIWIWAAILGSQPLGVPASLAWVAALPTSDEAPSAARRFVRLFVPSLALLEVLHAFPFAGAQVDYGAFLLVAPGAVCLSDGVAELRATAIGLRPGAGRAGWLVALSGAAALVGVALIAPLTRSIAAYDRGTPLAVAGAGKIRVGRATATALDSVVRVLRRDCTTFVTLPGLNSLYLMAGRTPPTWDNVSGLPWEWSDAVQRGMVRHLKTIPGLCSVVNPVMVSFWANGNVLPDFPLDSFVEHGFRQVYRGGGFEVGVRVRNAR